MSRHGYSDDCDGWTLIRWRGAVKSAIRGKRGQAFLREMADALDAMSEKCLIERALIDEEGSVCAIGSVCKKRGLDVSVVDPEESDDVAKLVGISEALARELAYENDEGSCVWHGESPEQRWTRMRGWVARHLKQHDASP